MTKSKSWFSDLFACSKARPGKIEPQKEEVNSMQFEQAVHAAAAERYGDRYSLEQYEELNAELRARYEIKR